jgi:UDPglucose 6-dehydrogenase
MRITVIGTGYLGAVHAATMAASGHDVLGVDLDPLKVAALSDGHPPFFEPDLADLLRSVLNSGAVRFGSSLRDAGEFGEVHFICVGTPQQAGSWAADLGQVEAAVDGLAPHLRNGALVVGKSTVPVGTAAHLAARVAELAPEVDVDLAWNPEFLREGFAVRDAMRPDRIVAGVASDRAYAVLREVYAPMIDAGVPYLRTDVATAELVKVAANAFLATKISFINAMAEVCDATGGDVAALANAIGHDPRIGHRYLSPGLGFGGGCLPKDIRAFIARSKELGVGKALDFLQDIDEINMRCRSRTVDLALEMVGGSFPGKKIAVLGAAFKPDSDDVRDSPALDIAARLHLHGAQVRVHDPKTIDKAQAKFPALDYAFDVEKACEDADLILHLTEWQEYRDLDPAALAAVVRTPCLLDARNALDMDRWRKAGWTLRALGRALH